MGAFNNYVDQILPNFDHLPPRVDKHEHFTYYVFTLCHVNPRCIDFLLTTYPPLLVHVVIEWPRSLTYCATFSIKLFFCPAPLFPLLLEIILKLHLFFQVNFSHLR